jgi:hypothetical protein
VGGFNVPVTIEEGRRLGEAEVRRCRVDGGLETDGRTTRRFGFKRVVWRAAVDGGRYCKAAAADEGWWWRRVRRGSEQLRKKMRR